jgi:hypothetical protein
MYDHVDDDDHDDDDDDDDGDDDDGYNWVAAANSQGGSNSAPKANVSETNKQTNQSKKGLFSRF